MRRRLSTALLSVLFLLGALLGAGTTRAAAHPLVLSDKLVTSLSNSPVSETLLANGTVSDEWNVNGVTVTASGPAHMVVKASLTTKNGRQELGLSATPPAINKSTFRAAAYPTNAAGDPIVGSPCLGANVNGGWYRACDVIYLVYQSGGNWYLGDSQEISGAEGWPWELYELFVDNNWHSGNSEVHWSPNSGASIGSCQQVSVGVSMYASVSETWTVCPNGYGPFSRNHLTTDFGGEWWSEGQSSWEGVDAVDIVHSPPTAPASYTFHAYDDYSFL